MAKTRRFTQYYDQWKHKVYSYVYYRVNGDQHLAEDLTSDIFLKAYEKFATYNDEFAFSTWIYTIARHQVIDYFRSSKVKTAVQYDDEGVGETELAEDLVSAWQEGIDREQLIKRILVSLEKIPDLQKDCIIMKYLEDMSTKKIAELTGESEAYVRQAISRGLKKLRPMMQVNLLIVLLMKLIMNN